MRTTRKMLYIDMKNIIAVVGYISFKCFFEHYPQINDNSFPYNSVKTTDDWYKCDTFVQHLDKVCYFMDISL